MIKNIALAIVIYVLFAGLLTYFYFGLAFSLSLALGGLMMLINLAGLAYFWRLIFAKKSIALAVFVIIFKYVILGMILWNLSSMTWLKPIGFLLGLASLVFAIVLVTVVTALKKSFIKKNL